MTDTPPGDGIPPIISPAGREQVCPPLPGQAVSKSPVARWRWWIHLVILGAYPVVIGGMAFFGSNRVEPALTSSVRGLLIVSGFELLIFAAIFAVAWASSRANAAQLLLSGRLRPRDIPLSLLYSVGLRVGVALAGAIVAAGFIVTGALTVDQLEDFVAANRPEVESLVDVTALGNNPLYMFLNATLVSFVVAGFREELWRAGVLAGFRAIWPKRFDSRKGQLLAVSFAAVLFGIGHISQGAMAVFLTAVLGFLLGAIMVFHRSIWPAVLAHGAFNATSFLLLPWAMKYLPAL